jgi:putative nucleotidyltransferase with HDIG domain
MTDHRPDPVAPSQAPPLATVWQVSEGLRRVFGSPGYKPPMLPSVALEIHELSCRPDIENDKLIGVLERDPMLAGHVLKVANSPIFRGRDAETSLRSAVLRLGLKNLGEIVFELALHMRVFRSAEYSSAMEELRRHSTACANLCRLLATRVGQDPENAFLCGLLHDIGIAAILIVLGERRKGESVLDPAVLDEVVRQIHEGVSGMLVRLWKLPDEVVEVVAHHHGRATIETAPVLSAVVAVADGLTNKLKFSVDFGVGPCDGADSETILAGYQKLGLDERAVAEIEKEAVDVLKRVDALLEHGHVEEAPPVETKRVRASAPSVPKVMTIASARKSSPGLLARLWRALVGHKA